MAKTSISRSPDVQSADKPEQAVEVARQPSEHTSLWLRPGFLIRRLHQIHMALFMQELGDDLVTPVQYGLLSILVDKPGLDQFSVAEELGIDRANVADVLKRLETRKLVLRVVDPHNRRRKICLATREGEKFVAKHRPRMQAAQDRLIEPLTQAERVVFDGLLQKLVNANNIHGRATWRPSRVPLSRQAPAQVSTKQGEK